MYKIKQIPEDFVVKEISNLEVSDKGIYGIFLLKKKNYTTSRAIERIAEKIGRPLKDFGYAGNKDKSAITEQFISIKNYFKDLSMADIELNSVGKNSKPISLGDLLENHFEIAVRNLQKSVKIRKIIQIINYFDEQRFSENNMKIGKLLLKRKFNEAVENIKDETVNEFIKKNPNNYIGALRLIPKKTLKIYLHAYQSFLFNKTVSQYLKSKCDDPRIVKYSLGEFVFPKNCVKNEKIPIIGFDIEETIAEIKNILDELMKKEEINARDFVFREFPELSSEGGARDLAVDAKNLDIGEFQEDELNKGKYKTRISFALPKGSYGTIVVKTTFSNQ